MKSFEKYVAKSRWTKVEAKANFFSDVWKFFLKVYLFRLFFDLFPFRVLLSLGVNGTLRSIHIDRLRKWLLSLVFYINIADDADYPFETWQWATSYWQS